MAGLAWQEGFEGIAWCGVGFGMEDVPFVWLFGKKPPPFSVPVARVGMER